MVVKTDEKFTNGENVQIFMPNVQGVITLMAAVLGTNFFEKCYTPLGEVMDLVALVNCTVNFLLYSLMSRQFRITFRKTFHLREANKGSDASLARDKKGSPSQLPPKAEYSMVSSPSFNGKFTFTL